VRSAQPLLDTQAEKDDEQDGGDEQEGAEVEEILAEVG
jgi:hypothetical protein